MSDRATRTKQDYSEPTSPTVVGDGTAIDLQDTDGTVGTTKGTLTYAKDPDTKARPININLDGLLKTSDDQTLLLEDILDTLKNIEYHLSVGSGDELGPQDIE